MAKKMRLITDEEYRSLLNNSQRIPTNNVNSEDKANEVLKENLPDDLKLALFMHITKEINKQFNELANKPLKVQIADSDKEANINSDEQQAGQIKKTDSFDTDFILRGLPPTHRDTAQAILNVFKAHPDLIRWNSQGVVRFLGKEEPDSNITDLITYLIRDTKWPVAPTGVTRFLLICKKLNIPASYVKKELKKYFLGSFSEFSFKTKSNSASVEQIQQIKKLLNPQACWTNVFEEKQENSDSEVSEDEESEKELFFDDAHE